MVCVIFFLNLPLDAGLKREIKVSTILVSYIVKKLSKFLIISELKVYIFNCFKLLFIYVEMYAVQSSHNNLEAVSNFLWNNSLYFSLNIFTHIISELFSLFTKYSSCKICTCPLPKVNNCKIIQYLSSHVNIKIASPENFTYIPNNRTGP